MTICYQGFLVITICMAFTCVSCFFKTYPTSTFDHAFVPLFGNDHVTVLDNGKGVQISLDQIANSGSGFVSKNSYNHSYFTAWIKLPAIIYTAGVVVTFYSSNSQKYEFTHDELDFEFLGHSSGQNWRLQTNVYGGGSTDRGREERYNLWFDPAGDYHSYSILWAEKWVIFYVDDVPIRLTKKVSAMGTDYPSKPMSLYATIWNGSDWATDCGRYKIDFKYAPFIAQYKDFVLHGCPDNPTQCDLDTNYKGLTSREIIKMEKLRSKYLTYSYCNDRRRYPTPLPECVRSKF